MKEELGSDGKCSAHSVGGCTGGNKRPIVMITSWPPRLCGIATFAEEAVEFLRRRLPNKSVHIISHPDGRGRNVHPLVDLSRRDWHVAVAHKIKELSPAVVHIQHEYGLYNHVDPQNGGDGNRGFLRLLHAIGEYPIVVEPHTVHGRPREHEMRFLHPLCRLADVVILKCGYQAWRLDWNFQGQGWKTPSNLMVIPHGARADRGWPREQIPQLKDEIGFRNGVLSAKHIIGLLGWMQDNKRWDLLTSIWEETAAEIERRTGQKWFLLAGGAMRDPAHRSWYDLYRGQLKNLQRRGLAYYHRFIPRGMPYYKVMALCDFVVLPSVDETQSGTLARIIALRKPYITTAPLEGLTSQTVESDGGLLFTTKRMLQQQIIRLACDEQLRERLSNNLQHYLEKVVSWDVVSEQYVSAYEIARRAKVHGEPAQIPADF